MQFRIASQQRGSNRINRLPAKTASSTRVHQPACHLQRMIGNAATSRLTTNRIQTKLTVSNPNDSAEQEADRFADQVMGMSEFQSGVALQRSPHSPDSQQGRGLLAHVVQQSGSQGSPTVQRSVQEGRFPGGGKVDDVRPGEHLLWNFDIGQSTLRPEHAEPLKRIAAEIKGALTRDPSALIDVEGQASFTGTRNDELSTKRAESVKKALVAQGIAADRLNIISAGSLKSLPGESQENFARSRGVRVITPPHLLLPVGPQPTQQTGPCQAQASNMVLDGATVDVTNEGLFKRLHAGDGNPPGMTMSSGVSVNPPDCGTLLFVQNVQAFRQIIYKDRTRNTLQTSGFVLDTEDPYPTQVFDGKDPSNPGLKIAVANDSPSQRIHTGFDLEPMMKVVEARDDFRMFLLFVPKGGTRQVLQIGEWSWSGQLNTTKPDSLDEGSLVIDRSASRIIPTGGKGRPTGEAPVLAPNVTSADWVTDNAGLQKTFADIHRPLLNRVKPKANSK